MDWGSFGHMRVGSAQRPLSVFAMVLSWSRALFCDFAFDQQMETFLRMHRRALEFFGGVPRRIVAFVIPAGYSFNSTGSTLYLAVASIFVAQAAGIHLSVGEQVLMLFTLMLTSKGFAGVPRSALVLLFATAATFHLPTEPIFVILGIDAVADMGRTAINVAGNCLASVIVAKWEGVFEEEAASQIVLQGMAD